jgi:universal stress protein E
LAALDPFHAHDKPSLLDREIVDAAQAVAAMVHGSVHATHVYRPFTSYISAVPMSEAAAAALPAQEKAYTAAIRRGFYEAVSRYGIARKKAHLVCGDPAVALPALARSLRAGLVVMGAMSRSGLKRIFIGNTAERVLDTLHCDVLIVRRPRN